MLSFQLSPLLVYLGLFATARANVQYLVGFVLWWCPLLHLAVLWPVSHSFLLKTKMLKALTKANADADFSSPSGRRHGRRRLWVRYQCELGHFISAPRFPHFTTRTSGALRGESHLISEYEPPLVLVDNKIAPQKSRFKTFKSSC